MGLIDFILNLAALLLWLNGRALRSSVKDSSSGISLQSTLKKPEASRTRAWFFLLAVPVLLLLRAVLYQQVGSALNWTPHLQLEVVSLPFFSDFLDRILLFSLLSFGLVLGKFYLWMLLLSVVNRSVADADPLQQWARSQLSWIDRWPWVLKLFLPLLAATLAWFALQPVLGKLEILPPRISRAQTLEQGAVIGLAAFLTLKYLMAGLLWLHLLNSYVYLGKNPLWNFSNTTARHLLAPVRWLPLRFGKFDGAPVVGILLILAGAELASRGLVELYKRLPLAQ